MIRTLQNQKTTVGVCVPSERGVRTDKARTYGGGVRTVVGLAVVVVVAVCGGGGASCLGCPGQVVLWGQQHADETDKPVSRTLFLRGKKIEKHVSCSTQKNILNIIRE